MLSRAKLSTPVEHPKKMQPYQRVRIVEESHYPGIRRPDIDAQFFMQLARKRCRDVSRPAPLFRLEIPNRRRTAFRQGGLPAEICRRDE